MEIERLRKELNELLENVVEHSQRYSESRPIPSLEISFVLSKINKMQERLTILKYLLEQQELAHMENSKKQVRFKKMEDDDDNDWNDEIEEEQTTVELQKKIVAEVAPGKKEHIEEEIEATIENEGNEKIINTEPEKQTTPISNIEYLPIAKLFDSLTLNDRYLYANELFDKDMTAFNELVKSIDNCSTYKEAEKIINQYEEKWDNDNEHVLSFLNLVERRFL